MIQYKNKNWAHKFSSVQCSHSVMSDSLRPCGLKHTRLSVLPHLPELAQTHVHSVGDDIHPSHPWSSPSPPAPNPSQHQGLFQWVNSLHEVAKVTLLLKYYSNKKVLPVNIQDWFPLGLTGLISLLSKGLSRVFSSTALRKHPFSALSLLHGPTLTSIHEWLQEKPYLWLHEPLSAK